MKKFELIKEYPDSHPLGYVTTEITSEHALHNTYLKYTEFWKEFKRKDYEILAFKCARSIYNKKEDGTFKCHENTISTEKIMLLYNNVYSIHSVKRLS